MRTTIRLCAVAMTAASGLAIGAGAAVAVPTPDSGPAAGGTTVTVEVPQFRFTQVAGGGTGFTLAVGTDGRAYSWGANSWGSESYGQLGDGTTTDRSAPGLVALPAGVTATQVAAGCGHGLALTAGGQVYTWGDNDFGQLGDGTTTGRGTPGPVDLPSGATVTQVAAGCYHSLAVTSDGQIYAWGDNLFGQLGDGTTTDSATPVPVSLPSGVAATQVVGGGGYTLALADGGLAYAWGYNWAGQLGDGTTTNRPAPTPVSMPAGVRLSQVAAGDIHSLAVTTDGHVYAWGYNGLALNLSGGGDEAFAVTTPTTIGLPAGVTATQVGGGDVHSLALTSDGRVYAWGLNVDGQLGDGTGTDRATPTLVSLPTSATFVAAGYQHSVALTADGRAYAWGLNATGELGDGSTVSRMSPAAMQVPTLTPTAVTFGGVPGTGLTLVRPGLVSVVTPAHAAGPVDVVVSTVLDLDGSVGPVATLANGYTFLGVPPTITTASLPDGRLGAAYSSPVHTTGDAPITLTVTAGSLPSGLLLDPVTGVVSGTPTSTGSSTFTVLATNAFGTDSRQYTIVVPAAAVPSPSPSDDGGAGTAPTPPGQTAPGGDLAATGGPSPALPLAVAAGLLVSGSVLVVVRGVARRGGIHGARHGA